MPRLMAQRVSPSRLLLLVWAARVGVAPAAAAPKAEAGACASPSCYDWSDESEGDILTMVQIRRTLHRPLSAIAGVQRPEGSPASAQDAGAGSAGGAGPPLAAGSAPPLAPGAREEQSSGDPSDPPHRDDARAAAAEGLAAAAPELEAEAEASSDGAAPAAGAPPHPAGKWRKQSAENPALTDSEWAVAASNPAGEARKPEAESDGEIGPPPRAALHQSGSWEEQSADAASDLPSHEDALRRRRQAHSPPKPERHGESRLRQSREPPTGSQAKARKAQIEDDRQSKQHPPPVQAALIEQLLEHEKKKEAEAALDAMILQDPVIEQAPVVVEKEGKGAQKGDAAAGAVNRPGSSAWSKGDDDDVRGIAWEPKTGAGEEARRAEARQPGDASPAGPPPAQGHPRKAGSGDGGALALFTGVGSDIWQAEARLDVVIVGAAAVLVCAALCKAAVRREGRKPPERGISSCTTERTACQAPCPRAKWDTAVLVSALEIQGPHHGPEGTALGEIFSEG